MDRGPMFGTEAEAKQFLVARIVSQAEMEGTPLSVAERRMLEFSEAELPSLTDSAPVEFEAEAPSEEYERKVSGLVSRAFARDRASGAAVMDLYHEAREKLAEGDHYLSVMLTGLDTPRGARLALMRVTGFLFLALPGVVALLIAAIIAWGLAETARFSQQAVSMAGLAVFLAYGGIYMIKLWRNGPR